MRTSLETSALCVRVCVRVSFEGLQQCHHTHKHIDSSV